MKKYIKVITIILVLILSFSIFGCENSNTVRQVYAYAIVHSSYIGEVKLESDKSGRVVTVKFEEYFMPTTFFNVANYAMDKFSADNLTMVVTSNGKEAQYINNISIDGENYTLFTSEFKDEKGKSYDPKRYVIDYKSSNKTSLNTYISTDEGGKWYVQVLKSGLITVGKMDKKEYQKIAEVAYNGGISKSSTGYWSTDLGERKGWALNMHLIETQLIKEFNKAEVVSMTDKAMEKMKIDSGASAASFNDYVKLAFAAYKKITEKTSK
ncbi:MAG: hypothetical protein RR316_05740 [Clostridia bacterium]